jgi:hypothetical protein
MSEERIEEGWYLGCDNVPPRVKEERERRWREKREGAARIEGAVASGRTDPSPYPLPQGEGEQQQAAGELEAKVLAAGTPPLQPAGRRRYGNGGATTAPRVVPEWQKISGLTPEGEAKFSRSERRFAIRKLFRDFERRAREALSEHAADAEKDERTFMWSPLEALCIELGIARRKLSALTRELTGMSAQETIDRIRAESVSANVKAKLAEKARATFEGYFQYEEKVYRAGCVPPVYKNYAAVPAATLEKEKQRARAIAEAGFTNRPDHGWGICANKLLQRAWDERRSQPGISWSERKNLAARQQFARELGFSSYTRLYRACLLSSGKTPMELEHAAVVELFEALDGEYASKRDAVREEVLKT